MGGIFFCFFNSNLDMRNTFYPQDENNKLNNVNTILILFFQDAILNKRHASYCIENHLPNQISS